MFDLLRIEARTLKCDHNQSSWGATVKNLWVNISYTRVSCAFVFSMPFLAVDPVQLTGSTRLKNVLYLNQLLMPLKIYGHIAINKLLHRSIDRCQFSRLWWLSNGQFFPWLHPGRFYHCNPWPLILNTYNARLRGIGSNHGPVFFRTFFVLHMHMLIIFGWKFDSGCLQKH